MAERPLSAGLHSIRWRFALPYAVLVLLSLLALTLYVTAQVRRVQQADMQTNLLATARLVGAQARPWLTRGDTAALQAWATEAAGLSETRVTIIDPQGWVLADSHARPADMDNHLTRPEVQAALNQGMGSATRHSATLGVDMMYVAIPLRDNDGTLRGIIRVALPVAQIAEQSRELQQAILLAALLVTLLSLGLGWWIAALTTNPVRQLISVARRVAGGDTSARLRPASGHGEWDQLTQAFNTMADQLQDKMDTLSAQHTRLAAILDNLADGVIITRDDGSIELINRAATQMLDCTASSALQRNFVQIARYQQLIELWQRSRQQGDAQIAVVELAHQNIFWQAIVTPLPRGETSGAMVILQDLSHVRRLETIRRDFISNISHELRTPLASLRALADTLRDGALQDPPAARHFLDRIDIEVDALTQMVEELLELSRIESGQVALRLQATSVTDIVLPPVERLRPQAQRSRLTLTVDLPTNLPLVLADSARMQQVVTNLVQNAIKFTKKQGKIHVQAFLAGTARPEWPVDVPAVVIAVSDTGVGISAQDLPRIFERFYKSHPVHKHSGTGLGLSIARHLVLAHGGHIWVESEQGRGSTFYFSLPVTHGATIQQ